MFTVGKTRCHVRSRITLRLPFCEEARTGHVTRLCGEKCSSHPRHVTENTILNIQCSSAFRWRQPKKPSDCNCMTSGPKWEPPCWPHQPTELWITMLHYFKLLNSEVIYYIVIDIWNREEEEWGGEISNLATLLLFCLLVSVGVSSSICMG